MSEPATEQTEAERRRAAAWKKARAHGKKRAKKAAKRKAKRMNRKNPNSYEAAKARADAGNTDFAALVASVCGPEDLATFQSMSEAEMRAEVMRRLSEKA